MLESKGLSFQGSKVVVSGSGNVSIYAMDKVNQLGAKVVACSDSNGYIYDPNGIKSANGQTSQGSRTQTDQRVCERAP